MWGQLFSSPSRRERMHTKTERPCWSRPAPQGAHCAIFSYGSVQVLCRFSPDPRMLRLVANDALQRPNGSWCGHHVHCVDCRRPIERFASVFQSADEGLCNSFVRIFPHCPCCLENVYLIAPIQSRYNLSPLLSCHPHTPKNRGNITGIITSYLVLR